jgi:hypothetical protein
MAAVLNVGVTAWSPLANGVLTGKYHGHGSGEPGRMDNEMMKGFVRSVDRKRRQILGKIARCQSGNAVFHAGASPPSRYRSDSIAPRPATGSQRSEAGRNGGPWQPPAGSPVSPASLGSASDGVTSHRHHHPAPEADALEPPGHRRRRWHPKPLTRMYCPIHPVERTALRRQAMATGHSVTPTGPL